MKKLYLTMLSVFIAAGCFGQGSVVYFTKDITPESLVKVYETLGVSAEASLYNVYSLDGKKLLTNAHSLDGLEKGTYIINGEKKIIK